MHYKGSPSNPHWEGVSEPEPSYPDTNGFVILPDCPTTVPEILPHLGLSQYPELKTRHFRSAKMKERAKSVGLEGSLDWLVEILTTGQLPTNGPTTNPINDKAQGYGTVESVGAVGRVVDLPIVRCVSTTFAVMFNLPLDVESDRLTRLEVLSRVVVPDTEARPLRYVSKNKKRMVDLAQKVRTYRATLGHKSDDEDVSSSEVDSEDDEPIAPRKRRQQLSSQAEEKAPKARKLRAEDEWDADFKDCQVGSFAVVNSMYGDSFGMCILKVTIILDI